MEHTENTSFSFRFVKESDIEKILEIYTHYILHTAITFEYKVPTL